MSGAGTGEATPQPLPFACTVCGNGVDADLPAAPAGKACASCGATLASMELAAAVLSIAGHGVHASLRAFAAGSKSAGMDILDLSGDRAVASALAGMAGFRTGTILSDLPAGHPHAGLDPVDPFTRPARPLDLLILRHALPFVPDLRALLNALARWPKPCGCIVVQDPFDWPLPPQTRPPAPTPDGPPPTRAVAGGLRRHQYWTIGADIIDELSKRGLLAEFYRPSLPIENLYRRSILVALRRPEPPS